MGTIENKIQTIFSKSIDNLVQHCDKLSPHIAKASVLISNQLLEGNKIYTCGNAGATHDAQYLVSQLMTSFDRERPSLPAIFLSSELTSPTTSANEQSVSDIISKQIRCLCQAGDVLIIMTNNENSASLIQAIHAAHEKQMFVILLGGNSGGKLKNILSPDDVEIFTQNKNKMLAQETNLICIHCICELVEQSLFGDYSLNN